jgi:hypothetical protein
MWGALSNERTGLSFTIAAGPRQRSYLEYEPHGTHDHILLSHVISPGNREARLYVQALGSLFVASYDSQDYGGGIRTRLHAELTQLKVKVTLRLAVSPRYIAPVRTAQKTSLSLLRVLSFPGKQRATELFPNNGCFTVACLHSFYVAVGLHVTILLHNSLFKWKARSSSMALQPLRALAAFSVP